MILSDWMLGSSEHFMGNQAAAREHFERGFARSGPRNMQFFGLDYRVRALVTFARVQWLNGLPDRALDTAREAIREAARASKPLNVCFALLYTAPVFLWCGLGTFAALSRSPKTCRRLHKAGRTRHT